MQTAWIQLDPNSSSLWVNYGYFSPPFGPAYIAAYFQNLEGNDSATGVRGMDYYLNGRFIESFNTSDKPLEIHGIVNIQDFNLNFSFVQANWSHLRPILNAYEIYSKYSYDGSATLDEDGEE
jgi:hypothetical protein